MREGGSRTHLLQRLQAAKRGLRSDVIVWVHNHKCAGFPHAYKPLAIANQDSPESMMKERMVLTRLFFNEHFFDAMPAQSLGAIDRASETVCRDLRSILVRPSAKAALRRTGKWQSEGGDAIQWPDPAAAAAALFDL